MIELDVLMAEYGSPLWLVDLGRVRATWSALGAAWRGVWADVEIAYSYKTDRLYHQAQSTQFGDLRPATVAFEDGRWHLRRRRETVDDLPAGDLGPVGVTAAAVAGNEEGKA